jgi:hypothetical protein
MAAIDQILSLAVASYTDTSSAPTSTSSPKTRAPKKKASDDGVVKRVQVKIPKGNLTATEFLIALRRAVSLQDRIAAIAGYAGYDSHQDYGTQEWAAKAKANNELKPVQGLTRAEIQQANFNRIGVVFGTPQRLKRQFQDLEARERLAFEKRNEHVTLARKKSLSREERKAHIGWARLESERLACIRKELAKYT